MLDWESFEWYILKSKVFNEVYTLKDVDLRAEEFEPVRILNNDHIVTTDKDMFREAIKLVHS